MQTHAERAVSRIELLGAARLAEAVERACALPAAPTQSWCACAAEAALTLLAAQAEEAATDGACAVAALLHQQRVGDPPRLVQQGWAGAGGETVAAQLAATLTVPTVDLASQTSQGLVETTPQSAAAVNSPLRSQWRRCRRVGDEGLHLLLELRATASPVLRRTLHIALEPFMTALARRANAAFSQLWPSGALTRREEEVLRLLAQGLTVKAIAQHLQRSPHTVHDHVKSLHRKLGANNRADLVAKALGAATH